MSNYIKQLHSQFIDSLLESSKLDSNPYSIMPSIIFLFCSFVLLYFQVHRYTFRSTRWKARLYKDVVFHWIYFYIVRIWFVYMKFARYLIDILDDYIEMTSPKDEVLVDKTINHALIFMFALTVSTLPILIMSLTQVSRRTIPNFLMWVAEDPWIRSEIGTSGHYLERPARLTKSYKNKNSAYRSRRSTSVDTDIFDDKHFLTSRPCKSMIALNVVKGVDNLTE